MKTIKWTGKVSIETAHEHQQELISALAESVSVKVDINDCAAIDLSGMQLLCSSALTANKTGKELQLLMSRDSYAHSLAMRSGFFRSQPCRSECGGQCLWLV